MSSRTDTQTLVDIDGQIYGTEREFGPDDQGVERVIIKYMGLLVFALRMPGEQKWQLEDASSPPAPEAQEKVLADLIVASVDARHHEGRS